MTRVSLRDLLEQLIAEDIGTGRCRFSSYVLILLIVGYNLMLFILLCNLSCRST